METVTHFWNLTTVIAKTKSPGVNNLRNHYIQCCRDFRDNVQLPNNIFGSGTMCSHCGSLWRAVNTTVRINKGRNPSGRIKKLIRRQANDNSSLSSFKKKLVNKCIKNQDNKLVITCSVCHENTIINLTKPKKEKLTCKITEDNQMPKTMEKRKKKKKRDKTAGLIINNTPINSNTNKRPTPNKSTTSTPKKLHLNNLNKKSINVTPANRLQKINISKLKGMIDTTITPAKRPSLHSFLTELG